jgi:hypothetical protein
MHLPLASTSDAPSAMEVNIYGMFGRDRIDSNQCSLGAIMPRISNLRKEGGMQALLPRKGDQAIAALLAAGAMPSAEDLRAAAELRVLASRGPDEAFLVLRRMTILGIDPGELARLEPVLYRNLHTHCATCDSQGRCAWDLADDLDPSWKEAPDGWQTYCPKVAELSALLELPWFRARAGATSP